MAIPVMIMGRSGTGKSTSMRNCIDDKNWNLIKVLDKPLPFKGKIPSAVTDEYGTVMKTLSGSKAKSIVIDDAGYLITNYFMKNHSSKGQGNAIFTMYNTLADNFWNLVQFISNSLPSDKIVYIIMHEDSDDNGNVRPKTIGKLLDEKICLEGMFTIVLRCIEENNKHVFVTQSDAGAVSKSPIGMFEDLEIDNDLKIVDEAIRKYYEI
ncbi:MAG: ATP-binding protein [Oscillospiraceae bacterium]|nr:ATP-binding protein [Oscillospiraceae bacterium]